MGLTETPNTPLAGVEVLDAADIRARLTPAACLAALEDAYARLHAAPADAGQSVGFPARDGTFHVKAGLYPGTRRYFAAKVNANFPANPGRGLPTIQGLIVLSDGLDGRPLAILDSGELTGLRTAAATALAARHGARTDARRLAVIGCGNQARHQITALAGVRPLAGLAVHDRDPARAAGLADWARENHGLEAEAAGGIAEAAADADIIVTCTTAARPILTPAMVPAGAFVAAVGADNPEKQELDPALFRRARVLVDDAAQCAQGGDRAPALRAGAITEDGVAADLAALAAGAKPGRTGADEIVIFDSTGTGVQDVAAAVAAVVGG
ncbi:MAG: ornithine cyclodeaminase family protein [Magnetovibrio sp.]|nr:ornithine cyclodeaminase family protein [Magnetovibrio sp.]